MKKSILFFLTLFVAACMNEQITLDKTFEGYSLGFVDPNNSMSQYTSMKQYNIFGEIICIEQSSGKLSLYDMNTYELLGTIPYSSYMYTIIAKGVFTDDSRICYVEKVDEYKYSIKDIEGNIIYDFTQNSTPVKIIQMKDNTFKLIVHRFVGESYDTRKFYTDIYSLPGNGVPTEIQDVSSPHRNSRKYIENNQVLIDSNEKTYTITGQQVK